VSDEKKGGEPPKAEQPKAAPADPAKATPPGAQPPAKAADVPPAGGGPPVDQPAAGAGGAPKSAGGAPAEPPAAPKPPAAGAPPAPAKPGVVTATIDGKRVEVAPGTTVIQAALQLGKEIPHFCWHPDLPVDGNCRMCLVEIEKMPKLQIACNTQVTEGMVVHTESEKAAQAHRTTLEFLLVNHPIDCPVCDQAGECYLQDQYMEHGLHDSKVDPEEKVRKRKVVDLGPIMLDAERCVLCSRCIRFERFVTGTDSFEFRNRGDHTQIATFEDRPITHNYAGNLADVCPVGALLSHDFRFKMRVWFLESADSVCPGCSTGCNIFVDHRDGEVHRLRPRRNVLVNKSWMCDVGRKEYKEIAIDRRVTAARKQGGGTLPLAEALDTVATRLAAARAATAFVASPQATNEDLFAFRALADHLGGMLDFRVGSPERNLGVLEDGILLRADRNPNTQGCLDQGLGRSGIDAILAACSSGKVKALLLQGPELLRLPDASALSSVPFIAVMATHEVPELDRAHVVLPAAMWAEVEGTFTNYQRRVQRIRRGVPAPGEAAPRWEMAAGLLQRLGVPLAATSAREVFAILARGVKDFAGLDYKALGATGRVLPEGGTSGGTAATA
jgi:NADH-quinone oxidoreductase subunit G